MAPPSPLRAPLDSLIRSLDAIARHTRRTIGIQWTRAGAHMTAQSRSPHGDGFDTRFDVASLSAHQRLALAQAIGPIDALAGEVMAHMRANPLLESAMWHMDRYGTRNLGWGIAVRGQRQGQGKVRVLFGQRLHTPTGAQGVEPSTLLDAFDEAWAAGEGKAIPTHPYLYGVAPQACAPGHNVHGPLAGNAQMWQALAPLAYQGPVKVFEEHGMIDTLSSARPDNTRAARRIADAVDALHRAPRDAAHAPYALRGVWTRHPDGAITTEATCQVTEHEDSAIRQLLSTIAAEVPHVAAMPLSYWNGHQAYVATGGQRFTTPEKLACLAGLPPTGPGTPTWALCEQGGSLILYAAPFASRDDAAHALWALHDKGVMLAHLWKEVLPDGANGPTPMA